MVVYEFVTPVQVQAVVNEHSSPKLHRRESSLIEHRVCASVAALKVVQPLVLGLSRPSEVRFLLPTQLRRASEPGAYNLYDTCQGR